MFKNVGPKNVTNNTRKFFLSTKSTVVFLNVTISNAFHDVKTISFTSSNIWRSGDNLCNWSWVFWRHTSVEKTRHMSRGTYLKAPFCDHSFLFCILLASAEWFFSNECLGNGVKCIGTSTVYDPNLLADWTSDYLLTFSSSERFIPSWKTNSMKRCSHSCGHIQVRSW